MTREEAGSTGEGYLWPVRQDEDPCPVLLRGSGKPRFAAKSPIK